MKNRAREQFLLNIREYSSLTNIFSPSYVFEGVRAIVAGAAFPATHLLWAAGLSALYIFLAIGFFVRVYRYAVRTGLLARYSTETVSCGM